MSPVGPEGRKDVHDWKYAGLKFLSPRNSHEGVGNFVKTVSNMAHQKSRDVNYAEFDSPSLGVLLRLPLGLGWNW